MPAFTAEISMPEFEIEQFLKALQISMEAIMQEGAKRFYIAGIDKVPIRTGFVWGSWQNLAELARTGIEIPGERFMRREIRRLAADIRSTHLHPEILESVLRGGKVAPPSMPTLKKLEARIAKIEKYRKRVVKERARRKALLAKEELFQKAFRKMAMLMHTPFRKFKLRKGKVVELKPEYYYPGDGSKVPKSRQEGINYGPKSSEIFTWGSTKAPSVKKLTPENITSFVNPTKTNLVFTFYSRISYFRINEFYSGHAPTAPWGSLEAGRGAFLAYLKTIGVKLIPKISSFVVTTNVAISRSGLKFGKTSRKIVSNITRAHKGGNA